MYFDTHAHYDDKRFESDRCTVLTALPESGIGLVLNAGTDIESSHFGVKLADSYGFVYAAVGVHPHEAKSVKWGTVSELARLAEHKKAVAIGEIGLDYHYDHSPREVQRTVFRAQLELARELKMPVVVHDREAHRDCMEMVREFPDLRGVFHCYSGSVEMGRELLKLGWYLSFTGAITFKNAKHALSLIAEMPADRIMLETDCPYLAPEPHRGARNDSRLLPLIAERVAEVRGVSVAEVERISTENGMRFFGL